MIIKVAPTQVSDFPRSMSNICTTIGSDENVSAAVNLWPGVQAKTVRLLCLPHPPSISITDTHHLGPGHRVKHKKIVRPKLKFPSQLSHSSIYSMYNKKVKVKQFNDQGGKNVQYFIT